MASESLTPVISAVGVVVGLVVLIAGVAIHGAETLRPIGGGIVLLSIGLLTVFLTKMDATPE